jgi:hypothetical protein
VVVTNCHLQFLCVSLIWRKVTNGLGTIQNPRKHQSDLYVPPGGGGRRVVPSCSPPYKIGTCMNRAQVHPLGKRPDIHRPFDPRQNQSRPVASCVGNPLASSQHSPICYYVHQLNIVTPLLWFSGQSSWLEIPGSIPGATRFSEK